MFTCRQKQLRLFSLGLLVIWLFFGSVALLEQLAPTMETSTQDEQALMRLTDALKPDVSPGLNAQAVSFIPVVTDRPCTIPRLDPQNGSIVPLAPPSLRLHQSLSIYRM